MRQRNDENNNNNKIGATVAVSVASTQSITTITIVFLTVLVLSETTPLVKGMITTTLVFCRVKGLYSGSMVVAAAGCMITVC